MRLRGLLFNRSLEFPRAIIFSRWVVGRLALLTLVVSLELPKCSSLGVAGTHGVPLYVKELVVKILGDVLCAYCVCLV